MPASGPVSNIGGVMAANREDARKIVNPFAGRDVMGTVTDGANSMELG